MPFTREEIIEHYKSEAQKHGLEDTSTIQDHRTRSLEIKALFSYAENGLKILEIGCGNGYTAEEIVKNFDVELDAVDFSPDMITLAKERKIKDAKGRVSFAQQDVLTLNVKNKYDLIFTERCLQNLTSWDEQKKALSNIVNALKVGGRFVMLESFWTGLNNLNEARKELELPEIAPPWHNLFFEEDKTINYLSEIGCEYMDQNCFLSGYYFGSRIIFPVIMPEGKPITSKSILNDYFCNLPPYGDFCPMKILRFIKRK